MREDWEKLHKIIDDEPCDFVCNPLDFDDYIPINKIMDSDLSDEEKIPNTAKIYLEIFRKRLKEWEEAWEKYKEEKLKDKDEEYIKSVKLWFCNCAVCRGEEPTPH